MKPVPQTNGGAPQEEFRANCPCPKKCERHSRCTACRAYHGRKGRLPYCERAKKIK
jgi:hypothetical protein